MKELTYGEAIDYEGNPWESFVFPDFTLIYMGYLPSAYQLGKSKFVSGGDYVFSIYTKNAQGYVDKKAYFVLSSGSGLLSPVQLIIAGKEFIFYPYSLGGKPCSIVPRDSLPDDKKTRNTPVVANL